MKLALDPCGKPILIPNDKGSGTTGDNIIENVPCTAEVAVGNVVRIEGTNYVNAQADTFENSKIVGICVSKSSSTTCNVQITGFTAEIFSGLTTNEIYFLSDTVPGGLTTTPPTAPNSVVQQVGKPLSETILRINITVGLERSS